MKILDLNDFISERMKIIPITNDELNNVQIETKNPFNLTEKDLIGDLKGFPLGVVIRMLEETELQGNEPNVKMFQINRSAGFTWSETEDGNLFWSSIINKRDFDKFYKKYPKYKKYNLQFKIKTLK